MCIDGPAYGLVTSSVNQVTKSYFNRFGYPVQIPGEVTRRGYPVQLPGEVTRLSYPAFEVRSC